MAFRVAFPAAYPRYIIDPGAAFPECPRLVQNTNDTERPLAALTLVVAYLLAGYPLPGSQSTLSPEQLHTELQAGADSLSVPLERIFEWAKSINMPANVMPNDEIMALVPKRIECVNITLKAYQIRAAGWSGLRRGAVLDFGCGVGKTVTGVAAAITAVRAGMCSNARLVIVAPVNASGVWADHVPELVPWFKEIIIRTPDTLHHLKNLDDVGGAMIVDEAHREGSMNAERTQAAHVVRGKFDWCICLSGSLLDTGPEVILSVQDLAVPGLSRVIDKYSFGEEFHCLAVTKVPTARGMQTRRKLVLVPEEEEPRLATYLMRGTLSLSFESQEVIDSGVTVPPQHSYLVDEWERPEWAGDPATYIWCPDTPWQEYMGYMSVAMMHESLAETKMYLGQHMPEGLEAANPYVWIKDQLADPLFPHEHRDEMEGLLKEAGLPNFSRLLFAYLREGRYDRVIRRVEVENEAGLKRLDFRWDYAPGTVWYSPGAGPKIQYVLKWLAENPGESLVAGGAGVRTVEALCRALATAGITHGLIRGGVPSKERKKLEKAFQSGEIRVLVAQEIAGSESITLTRAAYSMLLDHEWKPTPYIQFKGRTRRVGQLRETHHTDLAFNPRQAHLIKLIRRGGEFDTNVRKALEEQFTTWTSSTSGMDSFSPLVSQVASS